MDEIIVNEGVTEGWMQVPLSPKEVGILKSLPEEGKHEFTENVHRYIETVGDDYKVTPPDAIPAQERNPPGIGTAPGKVTPDAVPAQEPAGVIVESTDGGITFHVILPPELSPSITSMVPGGLGMTEEEMERVISVLKALPEINIEEVLR